MAEDGRLNLGTGIDDTGFRKGTDALKQAVASLERSIQKSGEHMQKAIDGAFDGTDTAGFTRKIDEANIAVDKLSVKLAKAQQALADYEQTKIPTDDYKNVSTELDRAIAKLGTLEERKRIMGDLGVKANSREWRRLQEQIDTVNESINALMQEKISMETSGTAFIDPTTTQKYEELRAKIAQIVEERNRAIAKLREMQQAENQQPVTLSENVDSRGFGKAQEEMRDTEATAKKTSQATAKAWAAVKVAVNGVFRAFKAVVSAAWSAAKAGAKFTASLGRAAFSVIKRGLSAVVSGFKKLASRGRETSLSAKNLVSALTNLKSMLISRIKSTFIGFLFEQAQQGVQELAKFDSRFDTSVSNMRNRTTELAANIVSSFGTLVRSVEPFITKIIDTASNAMTVISAMLAKLRGESTVAVAKKQTASYADSLDDTASSADKAAKAQKKYNATVASFDQLHKLNDNSDDSSTKDAEKTNAALDLFENASVDSILGGMPDIGSELIRRLVASVKNGDWYAVGKTIADGLNIVVKKIRGSIAKVRPVAVKWAHNISEAIYGIVDNIDGKEIGKMLAEAFNLAVDVVGEFVSKPKIWVSIARTLADGINGFVRGIRFANLGEKINGALVGVSAAIWEFFRTIDGARIGEGIRTALSKIDWEKIWRFVTGAAAYAIGDFGDFITGLLGGSLTETDWDSVGKTIAAGFRKIFNAFDFNAIGSSIGDAITGLFTMINGFLEEIDWEKAARTVAEGIDELLAHIDFNEIANFFSNGINIVVELAEGFVDGINWDERGAQLGESLQTFFDGIDWDNIGETLAKSFNTAVSFIFNAISKIKWVENGERLATGVNKFIHGVDWTKVGQTLHDLFVGAFSFLATFVEDIDWFELGQGIADALRELDKDGDLTSAVHELFGAILGGLAAFLMGLIGDAIDEVAEWWKTNAFNEEGKFTMEGFLEGIGSAVYDIVQWVKDNVVQPFIDGFKKALKIESPSKVMKEIGEFTMEGLLLGLKTKWESLKKWVTQQCTVIKNKFSTGFENVKTEAVNKFGLMKSAILLVVSGMTTRLDNKVALIKSTLSTGWDSIASTAGTKWGDIETTVTGKMSGITASVLLEAVNLKTELYNKFIDIWNALATLDFSYIGQNILAGIQRGFDDKWGVVGKVTSTLFGKVIGIAEKVFDINSPSKVFEKIGGYTMEGLAEGIKAGEKDALRATAAAAADVADRMQTDLSNTAQVELAADSVTDKLTDIARAFAAIAQVLASMGELRVPQMATGTIIPPKTRLSGIPGSGDSEDDAPALLGEIVKLLRARNESDARPAKAQIEVISKLDKRELARAVAEVEISNGRISNGRTR